MNKFNTFSARKKAEERYKESLGAWSEEVHEKWMKWRDQWSKEYQKEYSRWEKTQIFGCSVEEADKFY